MDVLRKDFYQHHLRLWPYLSGLYCLWKQCRTYLRIGCVLGKHALGTHTSLQWPLGLLAYPLVFFCLRCASLHVQGKMRLYTLCGVSTGLIGQGGVRESQGDMWKLRSLTLKRARCSLSPKSALSSTQNKFRERLFPNLDILQLYIWTNENKSPWSGEVQKDLTSEYS